MDQAFRLRLERVYARHPLNAEAILERVRTQRGTLDGITSVDLAEAPGGGPTDQNHAGGAEACRALARAAGLEPGWAVLDVGTGLGGTPRLLAEAFGCRCHGVELTGHRFRDAVRLTQLVGLTPRVSFSHGDFMEVDVPGGPFDLAIVQGAVMHFPDVPALLRAVAAQVRPGGRIAIEDGVLTREPSGSEERELLLRLQDDWNGRFPRRDDWPSFLGAAGFRLDRTDEMTSTALRDLASLLRESAAGRLRGVTAAEHEGWELGHRFLLSGLLAHVRILGTRVSP